jgi:hypothetical protein
MADAVPPRVAAAVQSADLGELHGVYTVTSNLLLAILWWVNAFAIVGPSGLVALSVSPGSVDNDSAMREIITRLLGVVLTLCAAAMIWRGVQIVRNRKPVQVRHRLHPPVGTGEMVWDLARRAGVLRPGRNSEEYRIVFPQGGKVRWGLITFFRDARMLTEGVGAQARKLSAARKTPIALKRLHAGETLEFGPLLVDVQGVIGKGMDFAWREVASVVLFGKMSLVIQATNKRRIGTRLEKIPDLSVLLRVIEAARSA